jgi:hypothetical protein
MKVPVPIAAPALSFIGESGGRCVVFVCERLFTADGGLTVWIILLAFVLTQSGAQPLLLGLLHILPLHALRPGSLTLIPRPANRFAAAVGHVESHVLEAVIAGQRARREVHRQFVERGGELLVVRDFSSGRIS